MIREIYGSAAPTKSGNNELQDTSQKLDAALEELFTREKFYEEKRTAAAIAEHDYKLKRAIERKKASGTIQDKEAAAEIACEIESHRRFIADAESDIAKEKLLDVRAAVSARQSILNAETRRPI